MPRSSFPSTGGTKVRVTAGSIFAAALALSGAGAQSLTNIDPIERFCWSENAGWIAFRAPHPATTGARVRRDVLEGFIWGENIGWINLGDGAPDAGTHYTNTNGADFGINVVPSRTGPDAGALFGMAWGENVGWINFGDPGALRPVPERARIDRPSKRLRGYAWSENLGWINLGEDGSTGAGPHAVTFTPLCPADFDNSGTVSADDIFAFLDAWFARSDGTAAGIGTPANAPSSDIDGDGAFTNLDIYTFLNDWFGSMGTICE